jgi:predicted RNA-binding Zn-ribbon protein involved in translation (DUF1610 family)
VSAPAATCPSCRRSVSPRHGALGPSCPLCGGFLPRAKLPASRKRPAPSPEPHAEVVNEVAERLLAEHAEHATSVAEFAQLHQVVTNVVAEAEAADVDRAARREHSRFWRERLGVEGLLG